MAQDLIPTGSKGLTAEQEQELETVFERARKALKIIETYDQERVDRLCQAVAWAVSNRKTFTGWSKRASRKAAWATSTAA